VAAQGFVFFTKPHLFLSPLHLPWMKLYLFPVLWHLTTFNYGSNRKLLPVRFHDTANLTLWAQNPYPSKKQQAEIPAQKTLQESLREIFLQESIYLADYRLGCPSPF
jgi:hypothetical protein